MASAKASKSEENNVGIEAKASILKINGEGIKGEKRKHRRNIGIINQ